MAAGAIQGYQIDNPKFVAFIPLTRMQQNGRVGLKAMSGVIRKPRPRYISADDVIVVTQESKMSVANCWCNPQAYARDLVFAIRC